MTQTRFPLGEVVATAHAMAVLAHTDMQRALHRHAGGDWGHLSNEDVEANELALLHGGRLLSAYRSSQGAKFWIITEADRSATTVLLPEDY